MSESWCKNNNNDNIMGTDEKAREKRNPRPLSYNCLSGKKRTAELLPASYAARPSRDQLAIDSIRVKLSSLSATVSPVARPARSPMLTMALVRNSTKLVLRLTVSQFRSDVKVLPTEL